MASIKKTPSGKFKCVVRKRPYPETSKTFTYISDAKDWGKKTEAEMERGIYLADIQSEKHTMSEAINRYLRDVLPEKAASTRKDQQRHLEWWRTELGPMILSQVKPSVVSECRDKLRSGKTSRGRRTGSTTNRYLAVLSHLFTVARKEWMWIDSNPCENVSRLKEGRARDRFLNPDEQDRLIAACRQSRNEHLEIIVTLALQTGMRYGEIMGLTWADINLDGGFVKLSNSKNGDARNVPLVGKPLLLLQEKSRVRRIDTTLLFPRKLKPGKEAQPVQIREAFSMALKRAEIEDFRFHDCRHTAASFLAMHGFTPSEIQRLLGHRTIHMAARYSHVADNHLRSKMASVFGAETADVGTQKA